jgi:cell division protein FtsA
MANRKDIDPSVIASVDIGTSKIACVIGRVNEDKDLEILGVGSALSEGVKKCTIINIEEASKVISRAIEEAEMMAGLEISSVYVGISGIHTDGVNTKSVVAINNKNREVTQDEVKRAIDIAIERVAPSDREVLHVIPQQYVIDDQDGIRNPIGMNGTKLGAYVRVITANFTVIQNIIKAISKANVDISDFILGILGEAELLLSDEEKDLGTVLVDIGAGTTEIVGYYNSSLMFNGALNIGGMEITSDISSIYKLSLQQSEKLKKMYGHAWPPAVSETETIEVQTVNKRIKTIKRKELAEVINARAEEIFESIKKTLTSSGMYDFANAGVVLTGGTALLQGIDQVAEEILDLPCRIAFIENVGGIADAVKSPIFSKAVGILYYPIKKGNIILPSQKPKGPSTLEKLKDFFNNFFFGE